MKSTPLAANSAMSSENSTREIDLVTNDIFFAKDSTSVPKSARRLNLATTHTFVATNFATSASLVTITPSLATDSNDLVRTAGKNTKRPL